MAIKLDGAKRAKEIKNTLTETINNLVSEGKRRPHLSVVIVGDDPASQTYVASKARQCKQVGINSETIRLDASISEADLIETILGLNHREEVDGILVQLPLPKHLSEDTILDHIEPSKDVDGLHPLNIGLLNSNRKALRPCTPKGIISLLDAHDIILEGASALVIGRSRLVGKPIAAMLTNRNATVTLAHSKTKNMDQLIASHDIIVVAVGIPHYLDGKNLTQKHIVVDVGIHPGEEGLKGDVTNAESAGYLSPVPRGVGPMTIASLLENTLEAYHHGS